MILNYLTDKINSKSRQQLAWHNGGFQGDRSVINDRMVGGETYPEITGDIRVSVT